MTKAQLYTLLAADEQKVTSDEDSKLGAAAMRAAQASGPRAADFTLWIGWMASLKRRLRACLQHDASLDALLIETSSGETKQALIVLIEATQQHGLLSGTGVAKFNCLDAMQQFCRHPGQAAPALEDFVADAFTVVSGVLYDSGLLACSSAFEQALVLSRNINAVVATLGRRLDAAEPVQGRSSIIINYA
ncbi:MAG: hypothetical protein KME27_12625 [Lyngbya sp. HA4199-MV5]|jgi:hypothetical protein|nr:hypothetical protein [Lyngbya sp. HA4199-MV5]